jgi:hypothetical protein
MALDRITRAIVARVAAGLRTMLFEGAI